MSLIRDHFVLKKYFIEDDGIYPNSPYPVLHYKSVLRLPRVFPAVAIKELFNNNKWSNDWKNGIYFFHHYHSITHEVIGIYKGKTRLLLGGDKGTEIIIRKGDVLIIPAGVAHKNLGSDDNVMCIGAYPEGKSYDMNFGRAGERPAADENIANVSFPRTHPVFGSAISLNLQWNNLFPGREKKSSSRHEVA